MKRSRFFAALLAPLAPVVLGCQPSSSPLPGPRQSNQPPPPLAIAAQPSQGASDESTDQLLASDPSAIRLDDLVEALLLFLRANQGMPAQLQDLRSVAMIGPTLNINSPSGAPYAYVPQGLTAPNSNKRLVVYDPIESANGRRWCILVSQSSAGAPLTAEVMHLPEVAFRAYLASGQ